MEKNLPEIVFASSNKAFSQRISRWVKSGLLRKLVPRVYTSNFKDSDEIIVSRNLYLILGKLFPGALLSHRSALEGGPTEDGNIFLTYSYSRKIDLPGICVHLLKGPKPTEYDMPFIEDLFMSSMPRAFLENLQISRSRSSESKVLPKAAIEDRLDQLCQIQGEEALNRLRDKALVIAELLHMEELFQKLNKMVSAILRTRPSSELSSHQARARSIGLPYDPRRLEIFNHLFSDLKQSELPTRRETRLSSSEIQFMAFYEAYFSNYIEGTEFEISEAYDIVFHQKIPAQRPEDAHDIIGTFRIVGNSEEMNRIPDSFDEMIDLMRFRHHTIMEARPNILPGEFKQVPNRAGETYFVAPELVKGTLRKGFEMYRAFETGLASAIFMMFIVTEVHPFVDGNGRVARIMMNAELSHVNLCRILIPTVLRDDYLLALRAMSRSMHSSPLLDVMELAQHFSSQLPLSSYETASKVLTDCNAFKESHEARLQLPVTLSL